jgi:hypothetical protein
MAVGRNRFDDVEDMRRKELQDLVRGEFSYQQYIGIENRFRGRRAQMSETIEFEPNDIKSEDPGKRAIAEYYELYRDKEIERVKKGLSTFQGATGITAAGDLFEQKLVSLEHGPDLAPGGMDYWTDEQTAYVIANVNWRPIPWQIMRKNWNSSQRTRQSQRMREAMLVAAGMPDLAGLSHRMFFMMKPDEPNLWDPTQPGFMGRTEDIPQALPERGPSAWQELTGEWASEWEGIKKLVGAR